MFFVIRFTFFYLCALDRWAPRKLKLVLFKTVFIRIENELTVILFSTCLTF